MVSKDQGKQGMPLFMMEDKDGKITYYSGWVSDESTWKEIAAEQFTQLRDEYMPILLAISKVMDKQGQDE